MRSEFWRWLIVFLLCLLLPDWNQKTEAQNPRGNGGDFSNNTQPLTKVPNGVILVKGAWSSSSDSVTPIPEGGSVTNNVFTNQYFGLSYALPKDWTEKYKGPPPSDSGRYVLAQIRPAHTYNGANQGHILITAQDMFFTPVPASNALELAAYEKDNLPDDYKLELPITQTKIAGRSFTFFAYSSPVAQLHWYVLETEIRCHALEFVLTSRDTKLLESLVVEMSKMALPAEAGPTEGSGGGGFPLCIKDYANGENLIARVDPIFTEHKFNPVPVRIIIDKSGKVKHIHCLSAFPDQAQAITDAFKQWRFKPFVKDRQPVEVETGVMFGRGQQMTPGTAHPAVD
jgi:hypothetical protein